jgi:hypothetical protein
LESVTDAARTLVVACALSLVAAATFVLRIRRYDRDAHERLVGELRAANLAALLLAATGASTIGFTILNAAASTAALETAIALIFIGGGGLMLSRPPREALWIGALAFVMHALLDLAHRPGGLSTDVIPRWFLIGCAAFDAAVAALCVLARQR